MCGRFLFSTEPNCPEVQRFCTLAEKRFAGDQWSRGEVMPGMRFPVLVRGEEKASLELMTWGYDMNGRVLVNARSESITEKPMFSSDFSARRCAILTTGFFEWGKDEERTKFLFTGKTNVLYLAGIYNHAGQFVILTTEANSSVRAIHHRMPVILSGGSVIPWLGNSAYAQDMLKGEMPLLMAEPVK